MARFKVVNMSPRFLPVVLEQQLVPGTFEHALHTLIDSEIDLSALSAKFNNDAAGAPAYDPGVMLKIVLLGYSRGMEDSRSIERACSKNVLFLRRHPAGVRHDCGVCAGSWRRDHGDLYRGDPDL